MYAFTNHGDTESTEAIIFFARSGAPLTQRDRPLIGQTGNPPEGWDSKRSAEKRSQPCGHDLLTRWTDVNGWSQAEGLSPQAKALFPGRSASGGAREKTPSSVSSVPLW